VHQFRIGGYAELLRNPAHTAAEVRGVDIEAEHFDQRGQMRFIAEMNEHAMAMLWRAAGHVVEQDRREASVERAVDKTEREELGEHIRGVILLRGAGSCVDGVPCCTGSVPGRPGVGCAGEKSVKDLLRRNLSAGGVE